MKESRQRQISGSIQVYIAWKQWDIALREMLARPCFEINKMSWKFHVLINGVRFSRVVIIVQKTKEKLRARGRSGADDQLAQSKRSK